MCMVRGGGCWWIAGSDGLSMRVCVPPGGTNVSFEQFVDSPLSSWPGLLQTGSIFWTLGMPNVSCGHQCVIQVPWLHRHHILLCSWISGLIFCSRAVQTVFSLLLQIRLLQNKGTKTIIQHSASTMERHTVNP